MLVKKLFIALVVSLSLYFFKDFFHNIFNEISLFHIVFLTSVSVFFKEFLYCLFEYFEEFKLKDSIGKSNKGNIPKDIPSILNQDKWFSSKPEDSGSGTKGSGGKSIAEDWGNYQFDSDSDYGSDSFKHQDNSTDEAFKTETQEKQKDISYAAGDDQSQFEAKIAQMDDSKVIRDLQNELNTVKKMYESMPHIPASKTQIPLLEEKIAMCESRISHLETENTLDQSKDKGKGKANE